MGLPFFVLVPLDSEAFATCLHHGEGCHEVVRSPERGADFGGKPATGVVGVHIRVAKGADFGVPRQQIILFLEVNQSWATAQ